MNLTAELVALRENTGGLDPNEYARRCCDLAKRLEKAGNYEQAYEAVSGIWPNQREYPKTENLDESNKGEVLMRVGSLAGWLGSVQQVEGSQEFAKNLITSAIEVFESTNQTKKAAEAQSDLALCYWREGSYDEARIHLTNALARLEGDESDLKAVLLIRAGIVEVSAQRLNEALRYFNEAAPLIEKTDDHALRGSFHVEYGLVFRRLAAPENREEYLDRALMEYTAASFHFEQAGHERSLARVENNLGYLFFTVGRFREAHKHLDRARELFVQLKDSGTAAKVDDTRAQALLAEGRLSEAERLIRQTVRVLERGGEQGELAEAFTTYGVVMARLGRHARAHELLGRAMEVAETAGDLEASGRAKLCVIEELPAQTSPQQMAVEYAAAAKLLDGSQDPTTVRRLLACAMMVIEALTSRTEQSEVEAASWEGFSFKREVLKVEKSLIERALRDAGGSVTKGARLLGFRHHQSLIALINSRHRDLLGTRSAVRKRRQHLFSKPRRIKKTPTVQPEVAGDGSGSGAS
jgi:tetratricopeptide (TPR) repeat protein